MARLVAFFLVLAPLLAQADVFADQPIQPNKRGYLFEIHGSNTIGAELAPALVSRWFKNHGFTAVQTRVTEGDNEKIVTALSPSGQVARVFIAAHGSGTGFQQILNGRADLAAASRPAKASENAFFPSSDVMTPAHEQVLAIDGIAVISHPELNRNALTIDEIGRLFSGQIDNWHQLDGPDLPVTVLARDDKSGTFDTFDSLVLGRGFSLAPQAQRFESNDELSAAVAATPGGIGFTSLATIGDARAIAISDGDSTPMLPEEAVIATEDYPLSRRLYLYQVDTQNPFALDFLTYTKKPDGQRVVSRIGFVSQNLREIPMTIQGTLPAGYTLITENSHRITTNFRFRQGTRELDNKALDDLKRLGDFMTRPENTQRKLILIGFSNQQRNAFSARLLSEARVIQVKRALAEYGVEASALTGYGQINPVASNADQRYALRNQRVEVWIR